MTNLVKFFNTLRLAGIRHSVAESVDALKALEYIDLTQRAQVKAVLSASLAKSLYEKHLFSEVFDFFFADPDERTKRHEAEVKDITSKRQEISNAAESLKFQYEILELSNQYKESFTALKENEQKKILEFLEKTSSGKNVKIEFKPVVTKTVESMIKKFDTLGTNSPYYGLSDSDYIPSEQDLVALDARNSVNNIEPLPDKNILEFDNIEMQKAIRLIRIIIKNIKNKQKGRRVKKGGHHRLDFKRTLRSNVSSGWVPFRLYYQKPRLKKDKYILLADVSASMHKYSDFVVRFIKELRFAVSIADSFVFSNSCRRKTDDTFEGGTDLSKALSYILKEAHNILSKSSVLVIISDARTVNPKQAAIKLKEISFKVKKVIWLNPLPESKWESINEIDEFKKHSDMLDFSTLRKLEKII